MKKSATTIRLSASDLSNHLNCRHLTILDLDVAAGGRLAPAWNSPDAQILRERGIAHEDGYIEHLRASGLTVVGFRDFGSDEQAVAETVLAMQAGVDIIVQAAFRDGNWFGRADVLRKVERASRLGNWSYEAYDCKLARETKAATILQLSLYSHLLEAAQGALPEFMYVVPPGETFDPETYRVLDYAAYYRYVKSRLAIHRYRRTKVWHSCSEPYRLRDRRAKRSVDLSYLFLQGALLQRIKNAVDVRRFCLVLRWSFGWRIRLYVDGYFEALQCSQDEPDFGSWFPLLHFDKPLPACPGFLS